MTQPSCIILPTVVSRPEPVTGFEAVAESEASAVAGFDSVAESEASAVAGCDSVSGTAWILNSLSRTQIDTPLRRPLI